MFSVTFCNDPRRFRNFSYATQRSVMLRYALYRLQLAHALGECILWRGGSDALFPNDFGGALVILTLFQRYFMGSKNLKWVTWHEHAPIWDSLSSVGWDCYDQPTPILKSPVRIYAKQCKMYSLGCFCEGVRVTTCGSLAMSPFNRAHTTSCSI